MRDRTWPGYVVVFALLCVSACAGRQTPATPTGALRVQFDHPKSAYLFEDIVEVDGKPHPVGRGRGGELTLSLAPGRYPVHMSSARLRYVPTPVESEDLAGGQCVDSECNFRQSSRRTEFEMHARELSRCRNLVEVEVRAGQTVALQHGTLADGKCP